jgi:hypothetical protein
MLKSGYRIFWLLYFQVRAFCGYAIFRFCKKQGYCIFRYAIFSHPPPSWSDLTGQGLLLKGEDTEAL